jgi:membrane-associated phospholipid phosphatase
MDTVTSVVMSIDNPIIRGAGMLLNDTLVYGLIIVVLVFLGESRNDKRKKILGSLVIAFLLTFSLKYALAYDRPCAGDGWCPEGYSFPSAHAAIAFTLMTAFLNKKNYSLYLLFALFVGFSRLNIGVHTFHDVAAALPVAMLSYYVTNIVWRRIK